MSVLTQLDATRGELSVHAAEPSLVEVDLGDRAQGSAQAILWIRSDVEIGHGAEATCTVRPREPFRPERLAVLAACAGSFDLVDLKVTLCSVFADVSITVRHHQDTPPSALEAVILGTVLSDEEGYRTYLKEQQTLEQAWCGRLRH